MIREIKRIRATNRSAYLEGMITEAEATRVHNELRDLQEMVEEKMSKREYVPSINVFNLIYGTEIL